MAAKSLRNGENLPAYKLQDLQAALNYRMDSMSLASSYKNVIALSSPIARNLIITHGKHLLLFVPKPSRVREISGVNF